MEYHGKNRTAKPPMAGRLPGSLEPCQARGRRRADGGRPGRALSLPDAATTPDGRRDPERLRLNLVHHHLPLMAEYGFVQWDRRPLSAERGPAFEEVEAVLGAVDEYENLPRRLVEGCHFLERNGVTP